MNIFFIGDSLTLGINDGRRISWPGRVLDKCLKAGTDFFSAYNLGVRASASVHILDRWVGEVAARNMVDQPSKLVFSFGTADIARGVPTDETILAANKIFTAAKEFSDTIYITPPPVLDEAKNQAVAGIAKALVAVAKDVGIACADIYPEINDQKAFIEDLLGTDGVHPSDKGYEIIAEAVWRNQAFQDFIKAG